MDDLLSTGRTTGPHPAHLVVDLREVTFLDTGTLGVLIQHWQSLARADRRLVLVGATLRNARALWVTGMDQHIPHTDTPAEALHLLSSDQLSLPSP